MTEFDDRESAFENKFVHDEETAFKVTARRNKLVGLWAAGLMGFDAAKAEGYAKEVVAADFEVAGDDDIIKKLLADFAKAGVATPEKEIRIKIAEAHKEASKQVSG